MIDKSIPLTDIHRHLDGNIRPETILAFKDKLVAIDLAGDELEKITPGDSSIR